MTQSTKAIVRRDKMSVGISRRRTVGVRVPTILIAPGTTTAGAEFDDYSISVSDRYLKAVIEAGGLPTVAACTPTENLIAEMVGRVEGVLLSGGADISPKLYLESITDELQRTCGKPDPIRDSFETMLIHETLRQRKPLLAICRGYQMVNIALGGTLIVDLPTQAPSEITHSRMDLTNDVVHPIQIHDGSLLGSILEAKEIGVNSSHHQAVGKLAPGLKVTAKAPDGVVEAIEFCERQSSFFLGVQFHPERLTDCLPKFKNIFKSFIAACAR
jgi:putative glutamine amidotransferase